MECGMGKNMGVYGLRHQRSRLSGEIAVLESRNAKHKEKLAKLKAAVTANNRRIAALQKEIEVLGESAKLAFSVSLDAPVPRRTRPKSHIFPWGGQQRAVLTALKNAKGKPLAAADVSALLIRSHQLKLSEGERVAFCLHIRKALQRLALKNVIVRVAQRPGYHGEMTWRLADIV
jgi:uncharacterized coiled-coil protein SlyX